MACSQPISITSIKPVSWNRAAILSSGWATTKPNWHVKPAIEKSCINYKAGDVLPGMNAGASLSAVPSPIEGSGTAWVLLGSWALSPARPTPIPPRHECRGFSALLVSWGHKTVMETCLTATLLHYVQQRHIHPAIYAGYVFMVSTICTRIPCKPLYNSHEGMATGQLTPGPCRARMGPARDAEADEPHSPRREDV